MSEDAVGACERLYLLAMETGEKTTSTKTERKSEGSYTNGFRDDFTFGTLRKEPYTIRATRTKWQIWRSASDSNGTTHKLEILKGAEKIFVATHEGTKKTSGFAGPDEHSTGSKPMDPEPWAVEEGALPSAIVELLSAQIA